MNKVLKIVLAIILILVVLVLVIAALLPKQFHVERSVVVDAHIMCPFNQVNDLMLWDNWSPFDDDDETMVKTYEGPRSGVGAVSRWESEKQGSGSMIIIESVPFERIVTELTMEEMGSSLGYFEFEEVEGGTKVTWGFDDEADYPFGRIMYAMFRGMMEDSFDKGLEGIKDHCEAIHVEDPGMAPVQVVRKEEPAETGEAGPHLYILHINEKIIAYIPDAGSFADLGDKMEKNFTELKSFVDSQGIEDYGNPFTWWHEWDEEAMTATFDCGIAVKKKVEPTGKIMIRKTDPMKMVVGIHHGAYDKTKYMYNAIEAFIEANGLEHAGGPIETYVVDPSQEPDTSKWVTAIGWPVK